MNKLRNIAIIAHVDHGKTTLVDGLLRQSGTFRDNQQIRDRVMDSNDQERERGITILAKNTSIRWHDWHINIVDTPGHADFGGEVERILRMVDSTLLLVDAAEGPMPQTKFVLRKSLAMGHKPIVVINKIDRPDARIDEVLNEVFDLFVALDAHDDQLDFQVIYASAKKGYAVLHPDDEPKDLQPLFQMVVDTVHAPPNDIDGPLQFQVATLDYNEFLGRIAIGRIHSGFLERGQRCVLVKRDKSLVQFKVTKLMGFLGLDRVDQNRAEAGDIVALAGIGGDVTVGETVCREDAVAPMPLIAIDEPTIAMFFSVNNSPFAGKDGKYVTSRNIRERLARELEHDVSLRVEDTASADSFKVSGRGGLHLGVLIESMRREGYELQVSQPHVINREIDGVVCEPWEELWLELDNDFQGAVIEKLNTRGGDMQDLTVTEKGTCRLRYLIPSRGLIGYRSEFLTDTRGTGVMYAVFSHYGPHKGDIKRRQNGVMIAQDPCETVAYALYNLQDRGVLCSSPGEPVYAGQIIGIHAKANDLVVNPGKKKQLTNMRASGTDDALKLVPPRRFSLDQALEFINDDELVEVTPKSVRLRKRHLDHSERKRSEKTA